ncbi:metal ABC transporter permease [Eggerthellaceae bacterium zg-1084]|uniref:Metal ABC transporter permease n=1 Tax=Berryella wangjianweii TaxID=2734634 RepID=A0A6M8J563_9ACTN|nr:metal ABC transporter permease [Berryella wangjianweii]NPD30420.1 metal ABC transporter permease [Berryella wangjianweii]NPD32726.1 metal ABC transporter permease [Eggerthellaceae bacterium zg-997]QKF07096.1 metal ABC transporter permease [Berryella wangjianweii]
MFEYEFMQRAFIVGTVLAVILPLIGLPIVLKRLSMMGDTLSHASLAGVAVGLCFGFNPLLGSAIACVVAGLSVEAIRSRLSAYHEISTVIVLAASIGLAGVFTSMTGGGSSITAYLFGSIVTIDDFELYLVLGVAVVVVGLYALLYDRLYLSVFDPTSAALMGIRPKALNFVFSFLVAISVSIAAKTIGSLIVSSLLVIPVICGMRFARTYRGSLAASIGLSLAFVYAGLTLSYYQNLKPGSVIVLIAVAVLVASLLVRRR